VSWGIFRVSLLVLGFYRVIRVLEFFGYGSKTCFRTVFCAIPVPVQQPGACCAEDLGFHHGRPLAALVIFRSCLQWKTFQADRTVLFDKVGLQPLQGRGNSSFSTVDDFFQTFLLYHSRQGLGRGVTNTSTHTKNNTSKQLAVTAGPDLPDDAPYCPGNAVKLLEMDLADCKCRHG